MTAAANVTTPTRPTALPGLSKSATAAATHDGAAAAVATEVEDFVDFCGLGGPVESDLPPREAVAAAVDQPLPNGHHDGAGAALRRAEDQVIRSATLFGVELARLRLSDAGEVAQTGLILRVWLEELAQSTFPVQAAHAYWAVSRGIRFLPRGHQRRGSKSRNYYKAEHTEHVRAEFRRLRQKAFVLAAHDTSPRSAMGCDVLALGCVVKKEKVRCVLNASGPPGRSINDDVVDSGVQFPRLRDAGEAMQRGDWLWKGDISDYYLNFPLRPDMFPFVMVELDGELLYYRCLCFGISNAVRLAQRISVFITEILVRRMRQAGVPDAEIHGIYEYLDDWLGVMGSHQAAAIGLAEWMRLMNGLGLPFDIIKPGKVCPPTAKGLVYLGIYLDVVGLRYVLDPERVTDVLTAIDGFLDLRDVTLLAVQQLHGLLSFVCVALPVGSHLLFHLRRMMAGFGGKLRRANRSRLVRPPEALVADMQVFKLVLQFFNGRAVSATADRRGLPFELTSDASVYGGCYHYGGNCAAWSWDRVHESADMAILEARVLRVALEHHGACWAGASLHYVGDNQGVKDILAGGSVRRSPELQAEFVRIIILLLKFDIHIVPHWIASEDNALCDAGSRLAEPVKATAAKYRAIYEFEQAKWTAAHGDRWRWRPRAVPRPEADQLWATWVRLTATLPAQAGVHKRKFHRM